MQFKKIITFFLTWRILLFVYLFLAIQTLPLQFDFIGGGLSEYLKRPYFWAWANFDGEHYLNIAKSGFGYLEQAFFPVYPFSIRYLGNYLGGTLADLNRAGLILSNLSFLIAIWGLFKLVKLDYSEKIAFNTILILLLFPTSFYFGSVYTEGTFLAFSVWAFYFARSQKWFGASILGALAGATRFLGILLFPAILTEMWVSKKINFKNLLTLLISPLGLFFYMNYLKVTEGDPLKFIKVLPGYGEQRQIDPVLLPQVFYRYFFKILPNVDYSHFPIVFTTYLEVLVAILFLSLVTILFFKSRLSYAIFSAGLYIVPTLTGSFSSLPRYVLVIFPAFILMAIYISRLPRLIRNVTLLMLVIILGIATSLFVRGYWVS